MRIKDTSFAEISTIIICEVLKFKTYCLTLFVLHINMLWYYYKLVFLVSVLYYVAFCYLSSHV